MSSSICISASVEVCKYILSGSLLSIYIVMQSNRMLSWRELSLTGATDFSRLGFCLLGSVLCIFSIRIIDTVVMLPLMNLFAMMS